VIEVQNFSDSFRPKKNLNFHLTCNKEALNLLIFRGNFHFLSFQMVKNTTTINGAVESRMLQLG